MFASFGLGLADIEPMDLTVPAAVPVKMKHGPLNLLGRTDGVVRACSLHPLRTVGPDGCPECWLVALGRG